MRVMLGHCAWAFVCESWFHTTLCCCFSVVVVAVAVVVGVVVSVRVCAAVLVCKVVFSEFRQRHGLYKGLTC